MDRETRPSLPFLLSFRFVVDRLALRSLLLYDVKESAALLVTGGLLDELNTCYEFVTVLCML